MKHTLYIIIGIALLTVSCDGRQGNAETAVEEFMAANLNNAKDMKITGFSQLDSTQKIKDSTLTMIRHNAENNGRYKKGLTYASPSARNMLYILRVNYKIEKNDFCDTYYLDESLGKVVAVKNN